MYYVCKSAASIKAEICVERSNLVRALIGMIDRISFTSMGFESE